MSTGISCSYPCADTIQEKQAAAEAYPKRFLIALDMFMNVLTDGDPDETISSRAARAATQHKTWGIEMSKFLDLFQSDHGAKAQAGDVFLSCEGCNLYRTPVRRYQLMAEIIEFDSYAPDRFIRLSVALAAKGLKIVGDSGELKELGRRRLLRL